MYNMNDYRTALIERDSHDMASSAWKLGQMKVQSIAAVMMASRNPQNNMTFGFWKVMDIASRHRNLGT